MQGDRQEVYIAYQITYGHRPDGWWCVVEIPGRAREEHGPFIDEDNVIAAKVAGWRNWRPASSSPSPLRP